MNIKRTLSATLAIVISIGFPIYAFANESEMASYSDARASNSGGYSRTQRVVGQAFNSDTGGGATITVVVNVKNRSQIEYHWDGSTDCYADKTSSTCSYEVDIYNPEVCTYSAGVGSQEVTQSGFSELYNTSDMSLDDLLLPIHQYGEAYSYYHSDLLVNFPIRVKSNFVFNWSDNVVPSVSTFSNTFTLTSPQ